MTNTADTFAPSPAEFFAAGLGDTPPAERIDTVLDPDTEWSVADIDAYWAEREAESRHYWETFESHRGF